MKSIKQFLGISFMFWLMYCIGCGFFDAPIIRVLEYAGFGGLGYIGLLSATNLIERRKQKKEYDRKKQAEYKRIATLGKINYEKQQFLGA